MGITGLLTQKESGTLEFKETLRMKEEIGGAVCAFANASGGTILIGVTDAGAVKGLDIGKTTTTDLAEYIKKNTDPNIFPEIKVHDIDTKKIISLTIKESHDKPVFFRGRAYKRVGDTSPKISSSEIRKLAKESGPKTHWDEDICKSAALSDIDWKFVKDFFIPRYESLTKRKIIGTDKNLLEALGCIKKNKPTNAGVLLFSKDPQQSFRNSYIALARYRGKEVLGDKLDYKEFSGNLFQQIDNCNNYFVEHTVLMSKLIPGEIRRRDIPEYGRFSVRELITNAVCHRNYEDQGSKIIIKMFDDRTEFYNIGGLPPWITPLNIISEQYSRNPVIAKVLTRVEYIEELGEGWDKIISEHKKHALKPKMPEIKSSRNSTQVTLFSTKNKFEEQKQKQVLNNRQEFALEKIKLNGYVRSIDIQKEFGITRDTANRDLNYLIKNKLIKREGLGKSIVYVKS